MKRVREVVSVEVDGCRRGGRCAADIENMTPDGWRDLTLAEVATVAGGGTPSRSERAYWNGDIPWATPTDVTGLSGRAISETRSMITEAGLASSSATLLAQDSLLMTTRATIGACAINRVPMATNQGFQNLVPKRSTGVDFLYYLIQHHKRRLTRLAAGSTFLELSKRTVRGFRVTVPPLSEQRKIAAILSSVDDAIEKTRAVIDQVQVVKRGLMQELLTRGLPGRHTRFKQTEIGEIPDSWDVVSLVGCGAKVTSGSRGWAKYYSSDGALFLRITNLARDTIHVKLGDIRRVALPPCTAESARTRVQAGDLLISITADLGMVGVVPDGIGEAYVNQHLALVRFPDCELMPEFAGYFLATDCARKRFRRLSDSGAKAGLNLSTIMKLTVARPPREEQDGILGVLVATEDRLASEASKLAGLASAKSGLMSVLLTGQVRVVPDGGVA